jgi:hypothetical protein
MLLESQVLELFNQTGIYTAGSAKPRLLHLGTGEYGLQYRNFADNKYFFIETVWFGQSAAPKPNRVVDGALFVWGKPNENQLAPNQNNPYTINIPASAVTDYYIYSMPIDTYAFARQVLLTPATFSTNLFCKLLIWDLEL